MQGVLNAVAAACGGRCRTIFKKRKNGEVTVRSSEGLGAAWARFCRLCARVGQMRVGQKTSAWGDRKATRRLCSRCNFHGIWCYIPAGAAFHLPRARGAAVARLVRGGKRGRAGAEAGGDGWRTGNGGGRASRLEPSAKMDERRWRRSGVEGGVGWTWLSCWAVITRVFSHINKPYRYYEASVAGRFVSTV